MDDRLIEEVVEELRARLVGRAWGKVFQLSRGALAVDFRTGDGRYLLLSVEPSAPRIYLIARTVRELEKQSQSPTPFALVLRKALSGATLTDLTKDAGDRVVRFKFTAHDETGRERSPTLVAQLTGRSANLFLLDDEGRVVDTLKPARGAGQEAGEMYQPPARTGAASTSLESDKDASSRESKLSRAGFASLSEALDDYYQHLEREREFDARASALSARLKQETGKRRKLLRNLQEDLARHGDADEHKRAGDLLLANLSNAVREGARVRLTDYYAEGAPTIELEIEEGKTLQGEAARRFSLYSKARRAAEEIARRMKEVNGELAVLEDKRATLAQIVAARDQSALEAFEGGRQKPSAGRVGERAVKKKADEGLGRVRRYRSSDGYEILVGRAARDNEHLTFRVARSHDLWLHAADYPGSHVIIRRQKRDAPIPHRTIIEAAQLAAKFSQARKDAKVAVHYTERKFVSKIKGAAPGLVRLASFRTLLVEPSDELERL